MPLGGFVFIIRHATVIALEMLIKIEIFRKLKELLLKIVFKDFVYTFSWGLVSDLEKNKNKLKSPFLLFPFLNKSAFITICQKTCRCSPFHWNVV